VEGSLSERLKISELAEEAGVPVATVRHYLREGLLPEGEKTSRNMAYYPRELVERIRLIKQLQEERFMPLRVIGELLEREDGDPDRLRALVDLEARVIGLALADERERTSAAELSERYDVPIEVLERLSSLGVTGPHAEGYSPSDERIVEAISRFRAAGYDESVGFTVHDAARFLEPLEDLARREAEMLSSKVMGRFDPERAAEMITAGMDPLRALVAAMHSKLLSRELEQRSSEGPPEPPAAA
jgi:DNA-binding transcriptional MerR regulator